MRITLDPFCQWKYPLKDWSLMSQLQLFAGFFGLEQPCVKSLMLGALLHWLPRKTTLVPWTLGGSVLPAQIAKGKKLGAVTGIAVTRKIRAFAVAVIVLFVRPRTRPNWKSTVRDTATEIVFGPVPGPELSMAGAPIVIGFPNSFFSAYSYAAAAAASSSSGRAATPPNA